MGENLEMSLGSETSMGASIFRGFRFPFAAVCCSSTENRRDLLLNKEERKGLLSTEELRSLLIKEKRPETSADNRGRVFY